MDKAKTDLAAKTLSDEDREDFLKERGLKKNMTEKEKQALRAKWTDEDILEVMGEGLF